MREKNIFFHIILVVTALEMRIIIFYRGEGKRNTCSLVFVYSDRYLSHNRNIISVLESSAEAIKSALIKGISNEPQHIKYLIIIIKNYSPIQLWIENYIKPYQLVFSAFKASNILTITRLIDLKISPYFIAVSYANS